jgi:microcystin synthetase protein McyD
MACRLPGADNLDQFWDMVRTGRTAWGPVPENRFNRKLYYDPTPGVVNKSYSDVAALVDYRPVDRTVCPISDAAIASYDLAHLTLCEVAATACRHAGLDPAALPYDNTGVYIGHAAASEVAAELTYATYIAETANPLR